MGAPGPGSGSTARAPRGQSPSSGMRGVAAVRRARLVRAARGPPGTRCRRRPPTAPGCRMSGWMRRHRLASRAANPACPASSRPAVRLGQPHRDGGHAGGGQGLLEQRRWRCRCRRPRSPWPRRPARRAPPLTAWPGAAGRPGRDPVAVAGPGRGRLAGDLRGQFGQAGAGLGGQVLQLLLGLGRGAAQPLHQHAPGQVNHGPGGRRRTAVRPVPAAGARSARSAE